MIPKYFKRISAWYKNAAVMFLTTFVLFIAFVAFSYAIYAVRDYEAPVVPSRLLQPRAMHRMDLDEAKTFFREFDRMEENETYRYQPWVGFSERVFHSAQLNVDEAVPMPVRRTVQDHSGRGGLPLAVWLFGGSTAFGWGVPDDETIASHLANILSQELPKRAVQVTNHGHSWYFSSQEVFLFQTLLRRGDRCDVAVFLDGLNDWGWYSSRDVPAFTDETAAAMEKEQRRNPSARTYVWISPDSPPLRLLNAVGRRLMRKAGPPPVEPATFDPVRKYRVNLETEATLGKAHGITTLFFWQPVPYDPKYAGALELQARIREEIKAKEFHFIAEMFKGMDHDEVYVDGHHYGDAANGQVAQVIAREVRKVVGR